MAQRCLIQALPGVYEAAARCCKTNIPIIVTDARIALVSGVDSIINGNGRGGSSRIESYCHEVSKIPGVKLLRLTEN